MGTMRKFKREIRNVNGRPLAFDMRTGFGASLTPLLERIARGRVDDSEIREMFLGQAEADDDDARQRAEILAGPTIVPGTKTGRFTALVSCHGIAMYDVEYQPYAFSTLRLSQIIGRLAADPTIETIFLDIDSPGGYVTGTQEAADAVFAARKKKRVVALVNPLAASAAYWIASQAETIIGVPSADVGSIGVFMTHYDCSKMLEDAGIKPTYIFAGEYKVEGNSTQPLGDEAKAWFQSEVDGTYSDFVNAVARGRGVSAATVMDKFGKGRCYGAKLAKKLGMIDEISTIQGALASWGIPDMAQEANRRRAEGEDTENEPQSPTADAEAYDPKAPLEINMDFLLEDGCKPAVFMLDTKPGVVTTYAQDPWPEKTAVTREAIDSLAGSRCAFLFGDSLTIAVANGAAVYTKIGETADGTMIFKLEPNSSYSPPPKPASGKAGGGLDRLAETAAEIEAEAAEPAADPEADRKHHADLVRARLAILGA